MEVAVLSWQLLYDMVSTILIIRSLYLFNNISSFCWPETLPYAGIGNIMKPYYSLAESLKYADEVAILNLGDQQLSSLTSES